MTTKSSRNTKQSPKSDKTVVLSGRVPSSLAAEFSAIVKREGRCLNNGEAVRDAVRQYVDRHSGK